MTLTIELLVAGRQEDLLREQRRLHLVAMLSRSRRAVSRAIRAATEPCPA